MYAIISKIHAYDKSEQTTLSEDTAGGEKESEHNTVIREERSFPDENK
jgi:hypothetical protein